MKQYYFSGFFFICLLLVSCGKYNPDPAVIIPNHNITSRWAATTLEYTRSTIPFFKSPTFISRSLGYTGLVMYESVVHGSSNFQSIASQLNGLGTLSKPESGKTYDWEIACSAGQATILKRLWHNQAQSGFSKIDSLESLIIQEKRDAMVAEEIISRSIEYGQKIAHEIGDWAETDGGKDGNINLYDGSYKLLTGNQHWTPPFGGQAFTNAPLHPNWGNNRNFIFKNAQNSMPEMMVYETLKGSKNYKQFLEVYTIQKKLSQSQKEMAIWWSDDPSTTYSPPGHSYNIALILVNQTQPDLFKSAAIFAKTGIAVAEAFVNCFRCKYHYSSVRPTAYIQRFIDKDFTQFWPEPPFPAFISGHSTQAAAAATVLMSEVSNETEFFDTTHQGRPKDAERNIGFKTRRFSRVWDMAEECGYSRIYGGIHTQDDNLKGLAEGQRIGEAINGLNWKH